MIKGFAVLLLVLASITPAFADAVSDFGVGSNPNGLWTYIENGSTQLIQAQSTCNGHVGIECWDNGVIVIPDFTSISKNTTLSPIVENGSVTLPPGILNLDPESNTVTVRWTAPSAGTWSVSGFFSGLDTVSPSHPVEVMLDSTTILFSTTINTPGQNSAFDFSRTLVAGDFLDFTVGTGNGGFNLGTGFDATVSPATSSVPEPSSRSVLILGLAGLACVALFREKSKQKTSYRVQ
jgi:hypothetical protein